MESEIVPGSIDVGILQDIIMVSFGPLNVIVMKVCWLKHTHEGRRSIKKDAHGFWTVLFTAREDPLACNSYIFPCSATQVFFVNDTRDPQLRAVVRHNPRSK